MLSVSMSTVDMSQNMAYGPILDVPKYTVRGDINDKEGAVQSYIPPMKPIKHVMLGSCIKFLGVGKWALDLFPLLLFRNKSI